MDFLILVNMLSLQFLFVFDIMICFCVAASIKSPIEEDKTHWTNQGQEELRKTLSRTLNQHVAKNVIFFIGDGMGMSTVTAARILKGQKAGRAGEEEILSFETFPHIGLVKTYGTDMQTGDSAASATAMLCGVKTKVGLIGLDSRAKLGKCDLHLESRVTSILKHSTIAGKSTGIVTTTRVTHATPAAAFAYSAQRGWEGDSVTPHGDCSDIAWQLVHDNSDINVVLGGGRRYFTPANVIDVATGQFDPYGRRDGNDLIQDWKRDKVYRNRTHEFVYNNTQLSLVDTTKTDYLLGLFSRSHMAFEQDRRAQQPSLAEMTSTAIRVLQKNARGYFLLVEGGRIDHGHHAGIASRALHDTLAFEEAVAAALNMTDIEDTLIIVTSDHSHGMTINGYPSRGNPILGLSGKGNRAQRAGDGLPYTTLTYSNGPGYSYASRRPDLTKVDTHHKNFVQASAVPLRSETHSGEDVPVYALGPMSHLFSGVHEQSYIAHALAYASCVGTNKEHCGRASPAVPRIPHSNLQGNVPFFNNFTPSFQTNNAGVVTRKLSAFVTLCLSIFVSL